VRILEAHQNLPGNLSKEFPIVVVGREFWDDGTIMRAIQKGIQDKRCIWLNYVSDFEKRCLLQASIGMIFTSLYEGFGLPILEAFACNTSVITSDCTSMPDVAGGCALLADPFDPESIKNSLLTLLSNQILTQDLKLKGFARAKLFNWAQVAKDTQNVYQLLL
jgi:alpha-1,3-rhamnosyl/mannosyltransferase